MLASGSWHHGSVRLTKFVHSCVRLDYDGRALVIDPGVWSEPQALVGVDAVLVTHEHLDHVDELRRQPPDRWLIDLSGEGDTLIPPQSYPSVPLPEDRLFIPAEFVPLWVEKGWQRP
jgi:glyoxylase-like metal-dependent hydrolase (beta-lactamase superfamily II)